MLRIGKFKVSTFVLLLASLACAVPGLPVADPNAVSTAAAETVIAGLTQDAAQIFFTPTQAPTLTPTPTPTLIRFTQLPNTETPTLDPLSVASSTPTLEPAVTATLEEVIITVSRPTNCRIGPGRDYEIAGTLLVDEEAKVLGRDPSGDYWYIPNPDPGVEFCWVWGEYATLTGSYLLVPMFTPPPTATVTATSVPRLNFKLKGGGMESCSGAWWVKIQVSNFSEYSFKSVKIEMNDETQNVFRVTSSNGFASRKGCGEYTLADEIPPEGVFIIDGAKFDYNIRGHVLRTSITMCTETGLKGICTTIKGVFNP